MPKLKTHKGAAKRFKLTKKGKIKRGKAFRSHLLTGKPSKRTKQLRKRGLIDKADCANIKRLLPYG
ncbi:MAG: 50S ribosomal protein L35 [Nitrospirae bacterium]|nr:50S ribosomal protein L35 [Nitrospirota bacterium]MBI4837707.1 50S ribosomal protein L35 [Nitrospirota bacterium]